MNCKSVLRIENFGITAMEKEELKRYNRQIILSEIGLEGQQKLKFAKALIIGAGGLGCPALQYLVAAGVGTIGIVDNDVVDESNLHRQILYTIADKGLLKAEVAAKKLEALNPYVNLFAFPVRLTAENADELFSQFDFVVDGSDNFETRYLVNDVCVKLGKPFVFGSIFGFEGQVSVFNYQGGPTYRCVFPEPGDAPNCEINGVLGVLPGIVGSYMANEALKLILQIGTPLSGRLLVTNVLDNSFNLFRVSRVAHPEAIISATTKTSAPKKNNQLSLDILEGLLESNPNSIYLVDVREPNEFEAENLGGINIPLSEIADEIPHFPLDKKIIFYCQSGRRSKLAFDILKQSAFKGEAAWV